MNLKEYCTSFYKGVLLAANLPEGTEAEETRFVDSLAEDLRREYTNLGSPYGSSEADLVRYLEERVTIEVKS